MHSQNGFWLPVSLAWLGVVVLLSAAWAEWVIRQQQKEESLRYSRAVERAHLAVAEIARADLMHWLDDAEGVSFDGAFKGRPGDCGWLSGTGEVWWMRAAGEIGFPGDSELVVDWTYRIEDLDLSQIPEPIGLWSEINNRWLAEQLRSKTNRADIQEPLPAWVQEPKPVLAGWRLDAAVYATPLGEHTPNCAIRLRFFLDLDVWNPWQQAMHLDPAIEGNRSPVWRWVIEGMPEVNLINHSLGVETGYQPLDFAFNESRPREERIAAWFESPNGVRVLEPGERWLLTEPNTRLQPQGLARLLHRSFPVRPADRLELRFRSNSEGLAFSLAPYDPAVLPQRQMVGPTYWRFSGVPLEDFSLLFERADQQPNPVYRPGLSQDFRRRNSQFRLEFQLRPDAWESWIYAADSRRENWPWQNALWEGCGWTASDIFRFQQSRVERAEAMRLQMEFDPTPLFQAVELPLTSYREWRMLPTDWGGGPGLGFPIPVADQTLLNHSWFDSLDVDRPVWLPINALDYEAWYPLLRSIERISDPIAWWHEFSELRLADGRIFRSVAELSASGLMGEPDDALEPSELILADAVVWARHGRHFAVRTEIQLRDGREGPILHRRIARSVLKLKGTPKSHWIKVLR